MPSEALRQKYYAFLATFEHFEHVWRPDQLYKTSDKLNDAIENKAQATKTQT